MYSKTKNTMWWHVICHGFNGGANNIEASTVESRMYYWAPALFDFQCTRIHLNTLEKRSESKCPRAFICSMLKLSSICWIFKQTFQEKIINSIDSMLTDENSFDFEHWTFNSQSLFDDSTERAIDALQKWRIFLHPNEFLSRFFLVQPIQ